MSREKQIDEIAKLICNFPQCINYNSIGECKPTECQIADKAEALYNAGYRKQEWISVDERLPEEKQTKWKYQVDAKTTAPYCLSDDVLVMAFCDDGELSFVSVGNTANGKWFIYCDDDCEPTVTHWMPLPEAPKMKGGAE